MGMDSINTYRAIIFSDLATALASNRLIGYGEVAFIVGDPTRCKVGFGYRYSSKNPASPTALTFAQLPWTYSQGAKGQAPTSDVTLAVNATATLTAAQFVGITYITSTSAAATNITLPTVAAMVTQYATAFGITLAKGSEIDFTVDNTAGANAVTLVLTSTGITAITPALTGGGSLAVAAGSFGKFKIFIESGTTALIARTL